MLLDWNYKHVGILEPVVQSFGGYRGAVNGLLCTGVAGQNYPPPELPRGKTGLGQIYPRGKTGLGQIYPRGKTGLGYFYPLQATFTPPDL